MNAPAHLQPEFPPRTFGDCLAVGRGKPEHPCLFEGCWHYLPKPADYSCVLTLVEDRGPLTLEEVGQLFGCTLGRIRQVEAKALARLAKRAGRVGLSPNDVLDGTPDAVEALGALREGRWTGSARPTEEREAVAAPAGSVGPSEVRSYDETMWCPHLETKMVAGLCARRHEARQRSSSGTIAQPVYHGCAECQEGAALVARLGTPPREVRRLVVQDAGDAGTTAPRTPRRRPMEAIETTPETQETTTPSPKATPKKVERCAKKGCKRPPASHWPAGHPSASDPAFWVLCGPCRRSAMTHRTMTGCTPEEAVRHVAQGAPRPTAKPAVKPAVTLPLDEDGVPVPTATPLGPAVTPTATPTDDLEAAVVTALRLARALGPDLARDLCALSPADRAAGIAEPPGYGWVTACAPRTRECDCMGEGCGRCMGMGTLPPVPGRGT